jgi:hypothetical protein
MTQPLTGLDPEVLALGAPPLPTPSQLMET